MQMATWCELHQPRKRYSGLMLAPGRSVVYRGEAYDVLLITSKGDVRIRHFETLEEVWADYYDIEFADPYADPGALLDALAHIGDRDNELEVDEDAGVDREEVRGLQEQGSRPGTGKGASSGGSCLQGW